MAEPLAPDPQRLTTGRPRASAPAQSAAGATTGDANRGASLIGPGPRRSALAPGWPGPGVVGARRGWGSRYIARHMTVPPARRDQAVARVAVLGPTASGKSAVALAAAGQIGGTDLISVDSMQVYRGMDIGTAKPTPAEREAVPHHLIDIVDPSDDFAVAEFQLAYREVLTELAVRGRRAILVGGTGLYQRVVVDDLEIPGEWPDIRARLAAEAGAVGPEPLHERLRAIDETAAARMEPSNMRRVVRALEVCEGSGRPFSSFGPGLDAYPPSPVIQIGLRWDRAVLSGRIEERVHRMMSAGLLDEVRTVAARGLSRTAAQALGYKELLAHLDGTIGLEQAIEQIIVRTRQFAVRQLRWFGRDPRVRWVEIEHDPVAEAAPLVVDALRS